MQTIFLPVQSTGDISRARASLRSHLLDNRTPPQLMARATAVLTGVAEHIIMERPERMVSMRLSVYWRKDTCCVELGCAIPFSRNEAGAQEVREQLERISESVDINFHHQSLFVTVYLAMEVAYAAG